MRGWVSEWVRGGAVAEGTGRRGGEIGSVCIWEREFEYGEKA